MNAPVTRGEFVHIFFGAMDQSSYTAINIVADVKIPAVKVSDPYCGEIYACYRAGILNGADASGAFRPQSGIKRSEVAAILSWMYNPSARLKVNLS